MSNIFFYDPVHQFRNRNHKLLVGGQIACYRKNDSQLATIYEPDGTTIKNNPGVINNDGRWPFKADEDYSYRLEVKDLDGRLLYTCELEQEGLISAETFYDVVSELSGAIDTKLSAVEHNYSLIGLGTSAMPLMVNENIIATKTEISALSAEIDTINEDLQGIHGELTVAELDIADLKESKEDKITYGYNQDKIITINGSAISAGEIYSAGTNINISNENVISVTGKKNLKADNTLTINRQGSDVILGVNSAVIATQDDLQGIVGDITNLQVAVSDLEDTKQDNLTFGYTDDKISSINSSAIYGQGGIENIVHDDTLTGSGSSGSPLGVNDIPLAVDQTMTAYNSAGNFVLGMNNDFITSAISGKQDKLSDSQISAISSISSISEDLIDEIEDRENADIALGTRIDNKQDTLTFGYTEDKISSINGSAFAAGITGEYLPLSGGTLTGDINLIGNKTFSADAWNDRHIIIGNLSKFGKDDGIILYKDNFNNRIYLKTNTSNSNVQINNKLIEIYDTNVEEGKTQNRISIKSEDVLITGTNSYSLTGVSNTVSSNSGIWNAKQDALTDYTPNTWNEVTAKQDALTFTYEEI